MARGPLLIPSVALLAAAVLARESPAPAPLLSLGLLAGALALGGTAGRVVALAALGLLAVWSRPSWSPDELQAGRAVSVEGELAGAWRRDAHSWSCRARVTRVAEGRAVRPVSVRVWLVVGGTGRPPPARRFAARGHLRAAPQFYNGGPSRVGAQRLRVKSRRLISFEGVAGPLDRLRALGADRARHSDGAALARALVLGDTHGLPPRTVQSFRRLGLGHLLAISGLHVGIVVALTWWLGRLAFGGSALSRWTVVVPLGCALTFLAVVGTRPAISRAVGMAVIAGLVTSYGSRSSSGHALALTLAAVVAAEPEVLDDLGFWLTASATCGVLWGMASARRGALSGALRASCAAQLFTLPWSATTFHLLSPLAVLHNLWAVPWIAASLVVGALWLALTAVQPAAAAMLEPLLDTAVGLFQALGALSPGAWASVPVAPGVALAVATALLGGLALRRRGFAGPAVVATLLLLRPPPQGADPEIAMIDVGQGESILMRDGPSALLVDGGGWSGGDLGGRVLLPALARLGVRRLDGVVLTHPDIDHCGGLADLTAYLPVTTLWTPPGWPARGCALDLVTASAVRWRPLWEGAEFEVGRWRVEALHPPAGDRRTGNDRSLVLRASVRGFSSLLTGDLEERGERALVTRVADGLRSDLLKVAHHGSRSSTGEAFLRAVSPRLAWISAGRSNRFGHPHDAVLERLSAAGVRVMRTDRDGRLRLRIDVRGRLHVTSSGPID